MLLSQVSEIKNGRLITKDSHTVSCPRCGHSVYSNEVKENGWNSCGNCGNYFETKGGYPTGKVKETKDSTNHLGEKEYQTYNAWREACKKINPNAQFEGDKDICQAKPGIGEWGGDKGVIYTKDGATKDSRSDDIQRMIEKLEDSLDSITSGPRIAEIKAKIQELEAEKNKLETGDCTEDSILTDILGNVSDFLAQVMGPGKVKDCKAKDAASPSPYSDVAQDKNIAALIELFSSDKQIKDHEVFHALAALLGIENPSDLEEMAYAMLQSYFSKGKYMTQGGDKPIDPKELAMGDKVEREHTDNPVFARKIVLDHLSEIPDYYTRLAQMEKVAATTDGGVGSGQKGHTTNAPGTGGSGSVINRIQTLKAAMAIARKENNIKMLEKWGSELKKLEGEKNPNVNTPAQRAAAEKRATPEQKESLKRVLGGKAISSRPVKSLLEYKKAIHAARTKELRSR